MPYAADLEARVRAIKSLPAYLPGYPRGISSRTKAIQGLLEIQQTDVHTSSVPTPTEIFRISFDELSQRKLPLDITATATPERYRLVDCTDAVSNRVLCITEYTEFPRTSYAAVSYVWRGNRSANANSTDEFSVRGAEDADPISLDVLVDACAASLTCGASHLWLDRLCIMQTSKQDKRWQIRAMYRMYCFATLCVVVPSGLRCLVPFEEETQWIHRAWTLQEVVAPPSVAVLLPWKHGPGGIYSEFAGEKYGPHPLEVVTPQRSAMLPLDVVITACTAGYFWFAPGDTAAETTKPRILVRASLLGTQPFDPDALHHGDTEEILLPNVAALSFATARNLDTDDMRDFCIWQCALVRTSSRPVDMVFSIMGMLGVSLDPGEFAVDDRIGATIALAREILRQGRTASWLGASIRIPPCPALSTFPAFPKTSVAGKALLDLPGGEQAVMPFMESNYPNEAALGPLPKGTMDGDGYHTFVATAVGIVLNQEGDALSAQEPYDNAERPVYLRAVDGSMWTVSVDSDSSEAEDRAVAEGAQHPRCFSVLLGFYNGIPALTMGNTIRAMLVVEHADEKYHVQSYFLLSYEAIQWVSTWREHHFCVGGPKQYTPPRRAATKFAFMHWDDVLRAMRNCLAFVKDTIGRCKPLASAGQE